MDPANVGDWINNLGFMITIGVLGTTLGTTLLIVGVVVWAIRRATPKAEDPAVAELKSRLARGEISPVEYEVRHRALTQGD